MRQNAISIAVILGVLALIGCAEPIVKQPGECPDLVYGPSAWSADGQQIIYVTRTYQNGVIQGRDNIYRMSPTGRDRALIFSFMGGEVTGLSLAPGDRVLVATTTQPAWFMPDGTDPGSIPIDSKSRSITWSAEPGAAGDGKQLLYDVSTGDGRSEILIAGVDGSNKRAIGPGRQPRMSPDGQMIVYVDLSDDLVHKEVFVMSADGSGRRQLTDIDGDASAPIWSPDGERIAFVIYPGSGNGDIFTIPAAGGKPERITSIGGIWAGIDWSPNGARFLFASDAKGASALYSVNADGTGITPLTPAPDDVCFEIPASPHQGE